MPGPEPPLCLPRPWWWKPAGTGWVQPSSLQPVSCLKHFGIGLVLKAFLRKELLSDFSSASSSIVWCSLSLPGCWGWGEGGSEVQRHIWLEDSTTNSRKLLQPYSLQPKPPELASHIVCALLLIREHSSPLKAFSAQSGRCFCFCSCLLSLEREDVLPSVILKKICFKSSRFLEYLL